LVLSVLIGDPSVALIVLVWVENHTGSELVAAFCEGQAMVGERKMDSLFFLGIE
jgi:hypothetical protein